MRRIVGSIIAASAGLTAVGVGINQPVAAATPPAGFADAAVASFSQATTVEWLPDNRIVVLEKGGRLKIGTDGGTFATALTIDDICINSERGLLGFTHDPAFLSNGVVYVYYTRDAPGAPNGCVNRVSRFVLSGNTIDRATEVVLLDNISSAGGNHNGGDLDIGSDGFLYVAIGDAGSSPRGGGSNQAAQDLSLLNGKILRITTSGQPAPGNPFSGPGSAVCATRGNTASTPTTPCQEVFALGLRNPYRFAFDRNDGSDRFFINDVGQGTREEVDLGAIGANYGWPMREGQCQQGANPPCNPTPAGLTDPLTDYGRGDGQFITAGAFVPNGLWPAGFDGAYLFGDGGSGDIWIRHGNSPVDYATPFATGAGGITDMTFGFDAGGRTVLYYVQTSGGLRKITPTTPPASSARANLRMIPVTPVRAYDTGDASIAAIGVANGDVFNGTTRQVDLDPPAGYEAALVNVTYARTGGAGFLRMWGTRALRPATSSLNADASGQVAANATIVPLDEAGTFVLESTFTGRVIVDVLAWFDDTSGPVTEGRYAALPPARLADTRIAAGTVLDSGSDNQYVSTASGVDVTVAGRVGVPADGTAGAVVLSVAAIANPGAGGFVGAYPTGGTWGGTSNVNVLPADTRANMLVVPLGADGKVSLRTVNVDAVVVDVLGYVTSTTAAASSAGLYSSIDSVRIVDTRTDLGFASLDSGVKSATVPGSGTISAVVQNLTVTQPTAPGWVATFPQSGSVPLVSTVNFLGGQTRPNLAFTTVSPARGVSYAALVPTELVVDVVGTFS